MMVEPILKGGKNRLTLGAKAIYDKILLSPMAISLFTFMFTIIVVVGLSRHFYDASFLREIVVEAHGLLMDILVFGIFLLWLNKKKEDRMSIQKYHEEIDDFRGWESEAASRRIRGNIRRLNKKGFSQIDLGKCYLRGVDLREVNLRNAILRKVDLEKAQLEGADLRHADMEGANLKGANLQQAYLRGAGLQGVDLRGANLQGGNLEAADMWDANLQGADLRLANLQNSNMEGVFMWGANLQGANLQDVCLEGANLQGVNIGDANLQGADLRFANLEGVILSSQQLADVKTLYQARLDPFLQNQVSTDYPQLLAEPETISSKRPGNQLERPGSALH